MLEQLQLTRALLTGGTGFVGRQIHRHLANAGCGVRLLLRDTSDFRDETAEIVRMQDLFTATDAELAKALTGVDIIVHAAWYAEPGKYLESQRNLDCLSGTLRLARAACDSGVRRFVGIGTCFEYDTDTGYLRPDSPLRPTTLYGAAKLSACQTLAQYLPAKGVSFAWCRLFYLYGEGEDPRRLVPYIRSRLSAGLPVELTSGRQIRDYLDVAEAGRLVAEVALSEQTGVANICSGQPVSIADLARRIAAEYCRLDLLHFGKRADNPDDPPFIVGQPGPEGRSLINGFQ